ncbi:MAG: Transrane protein [Verrucomicrobiota bacterium]|jgi:uncharacterized membrane protein (UPF0136 family)
MIISALLWVYVGLLLAGGLLGFIKAGSKASLLSSLGSAVPLVLVSFGVLPLLAAQVVMGFLIVVFAVRWSKTGRPMPGAPMILLTLATLTATLVLPS